MNTIDCEALAVDWLRAVRGKRSQRALSRRLGYRTNIAYRWESARCFPAASAAFGAMHRLGLDVRGGLQRFYRNPPPWIADAPRAGLANRQAVARFLNELRGKTPVVALAAASGFSRFQVARWLNASCEPRLPEFFALLEAASLRLVDFAVAFFEPAQLPSIAPAFEQLEALRAIAYGDPWALAVLRALELEGYRTLARHQPGFIARELGIAQEQEERSLSLLAKSGQIQWSGRRWALREQPVVDTRREPERARELKRFWLEVARSRLAADAPGVYAYNVFSLSDSDYERVVALHRQYFRELQAIVANSTPNQRVALFCTQLLPLARSADPVRPPAGESPR